MSAGTSGCSFEVRDFSAAEGDKLEVYWREWTGQLGGAMSRLDTNDDQRLDASDGSAPGVGSVTCDPDQNMLTITVGAGGFGDPLVSGGGDVVKVLGVESVGFDWFL